MGIVGVIILAIALFIVAVAEACMYISLVRMMQRLPEPRRKIQRTLYGKDWPRILEMTKLEKGGKQK